ncbi:MAG: aldo/keto reductase [Bacteroidales bacterium]
MEYKADAGRYDNMIYRYCGQSGLLLPVISLGLWHNFGSESDFGEAEKIVHTAFDNGITHFDIADNYGTPPGSAEETFGRILKNGLSCYRDEIIVTTKAGHDMWDGPYGSWGSRKHIIAGLNQSLKRMCVDYVDIFYSHRPDPETPLEETMYTLADIVRSGKALYIGISKYDKEQTIAAAKILQSEHIPFICYQGKYSMLSRNIEKDILPQAAIEGLGFIAYSPLAQGLLTQRYFDGIPEDSRVARQGFLKAAEVTTEVVSKAKKLSEIASLRGQTLAQMALAWVLKDTRVTSVICGASSVTQLKSNLNTLDNIDFTSEELLRIEEILRK